MNRRKFFDQLQRHEGLRLKPYRDTVGKLTIGWGRNLDDVGISHDEAMLMLNNDVEETERLMRRRFPIVQKLDEARYYALLNMAFNMGVGTLGQFKNMWLAIGRGDWEMAAVEALDSKWARQVGRRATELADQLRNG